MTVDLADRADSRAAFAAVCGMLLLSEPGPALAASIAQIPALAPLADGATAVEFERIFLRGVQPYESIFRSDDAQRGGAVASCVADTFDEIGFGEHEGGRWRVAGPDHLGLELRAHAHLVAREAAAWRVERPDEAARHVETQRRFFADHLAQWAEIALDALGDVAAGTVYAELLATITEFIADEVDTLRPCPILDTSVDAHVVAPPTGMGPSRLARYLIAPSRCGIWLGPAHIAEAAQRLGFPWRPMDGRHNLTPLVGSAFDAGEVAELVVPWLEVARATADRHAARVRCQPGAAMAWREHEIRARATVAMLEALQAGPPSRMADEEVVVRIAGASVQGAIDLLRAEGFDVEPIPDR